MTLPALAEPELLQLLSERAALLLEQGAVVDGSCFVGHGATLLPLGRTVYGDDQAGARVGQSPGVRALGMRLS